MLSFLNFVRSLFLSTFQKYREVSILGIIGLVLVTVSDSYVVSSLGVTLIGHSIISVFGMSMMDAMLRPTVKWVTVVCKIIKDELIKTAADVLVPKPIGFKSLADNFIKHRAGISASITSLLTNSITPTGVGLEIVKVGSMLGLEENLLTNFIKIGINKVPSAVKTVAQLSLNSEEEKEVTEVLTNNSLDDYIPIVAAAATIAGKEITGLDASKFLQTNAKNVQAVQVLVKSLRQATEALGLVTNPSHSIIIEICNEMEKIREDIQECKLALHSCANEYMKPEMSNKLENIKRVAIDLEKRLKLVNGDLKQHQSVTSVTQLITIIYDICHQVDVIRKGYNIRVEPVGIAVRGQRQIGKSNFLPCVFEGIKKMISQNEDLRKLFTDTTTWQTWHVQSRDEFDTGYHGQEMTIDDDAFQDKEHKDHLKYITFISPEPVGTVQANLNQKGYPFNAKVCGVTCNQWPRQSTKIQCMEALHARFPISIEARVKPGMQVPSGDQFDKSFKWLEFFVAPMSQHIKNSIDYNNETPKTLDEIVKIVVDLMVSKQRLYLSKLATLTQINKNSDEDDDEDVFTEEELAAMEISSDEEEVEEETMADMTQGVSSKKQIVKKLLKQVGVNSKKFKFIAKQSYLKFRDAVFKYISEKGKITKEALIELFHESIDYDKTVKNKIEVPKELLKEIVTNQVLKEIVDNMDVALHKQMRYAYKHQTTTTSDIGDWINYLVLKEDQNVDYISEYQRNIPKISEMISMLGAYKVRDGDEENFAKEWRKQRVIYYYDESMMCHCFWGPLLFKGKGIVPASTTVLDSINTVTLIPNGKRFLHNIMAITTGVTLTFVAPVSTFSIITSYITLNAMGLFYNTTHIRAPLREYVHTRFTQYGDLIYWYSPPTMKVFDIMSSCWSYIEDFNRKMSNCAVGGIISVLELFGIDVTPYWQQILSSNMDFAISAVIFGILSALLFLVYRYLKTVKEEKKEEEEEDDEIIVKKNSKGEKKPAKQRLVRGKGIKKLITCRFNYEEEESFSIENYTISDLDVSTIDYNTFLNLIKRTKDLDYICYGIVQEEQKLYTVSRPTQYFTNQIVNGKYNNTITRFENRKAYIDEKDDYSPTLDMEAEYTGTIEEIEEYLSRDYKFYKDYLISHYVSHIYVVNVEDCYHVRIYLNAQKSKLSGRSDFFTRKQLTNVRKQFKNIQGLTELPQTSVVDVLTNNCDIDTTQNMISVIKKHKVYISVKNIEEFDDGLKGATTYGLGHKNYIILNAHALGSRVLIKFWRQKDRDDVKYHNYSLAVIAHKDTKRDIAIGLIITKEEAMKMFKVPFNHAVSIKDRFPDLSGQLLKDKQWLMACMNGHVICDLPKTGVTVPGYVTFPGIKAYNFAGDGKHDAELSEITCFNSSTHLAQRGDCGGVVIMSDGKYKGKVIGFHAAGSNVKWYGAILTQEDLHVLDENLTLNSENVIDNWDNLILDGQPEDLPIGEEVKYIGKFIEKTLPAASTNLEHWTKSPFSEQFEEKLAPGPLSPYDERIEVDVMENNVGKKSLLMEPNSAMAKKLPELNQEHLDWITEELTKELTTKMDGILERVNSNMDEALDDALNGREHWKSVKGIEVSKAAGIPWAFAKAPLKRDMIDLDEKTGKRTFKQNLMGRKLRERILSKLIKGQEGVRLKSFSNSKLKDAVIKLDYVKQGRTRIFHCVPVESILTDAVVFGPFKEAFTTLGLEAHHAIGTNPHSVRWKEIYDEINKHPNVFDLDYKNYDKYLHEQIMIAVFNIMRGVINNLQPDEYDKVREVQMKENIYTYVVDYQTVYQTKRGNKSGSYLTTVINCIANDIYSIYCWLETTNEKSLYKFRNNVSEVSFGDDKIESVSDEYAEKYNYLTCKEVLSKIGHTITPGDKDGKEVAFTTIDKLQFLKRTFKNINDMIVAPLTTRSLESPFVWTQVKNYEFIVWENLIREQLFEALLHGKEYYNDFRFKLLQCKDLDLKKHISLALSDTYEVAFNEYIKRYYG